VPFEAFAPGPDERELGDGTRRFITDSVDRWIDTCQLAGDSTDISHALLGLAIGLATQETQVWLGNASESRDRRWNQAVRALVRGFVPDPQGN
jgi:hypothetical protein